jgi:hypothetical protein
MSDIKNTMPNLFRSLRADRNEVPATLTKGATGAEQRWPILKSITPTKSPATSSLNEGEKQRRRAVEPSPSAQTSVQTPVKPSTISPTPSPVTTVQQQLASGLSRMLGQKRILDLPEARTVAPMPKPKPVVQAPAQIGGLFSQRIPGIKSSQEAAPQEPTNSDSLKAVFMRLEQAHQPAPTATSKPPAFLSRLGKR